MSRIFRISLMLAVFLAGEKLLGFIRQVLIARQFGLSPELDAFNAANNLPDLLFALISGGALAIAFIPVLSEHLHRDGRAAAWDLFSRVANLVFLVTAGLSVLIALLAEPLVGWRLGVAPGFSPEQQALVAHLMRLNLLATLTFSLSGLVIAGLQANQHFLLPAIAPMLYDLGTLVGVLVLAPSHPYTLGPLRLPAFGQGVYGLVYGVILGALLYLAVQIPGLLRYGFRWTPAIGLRHSGVQQVLRLVGPRVLTVFCIQFIFLAQDNLASRLPAGAVTALVYGWLIMQVPETLIGTAIGTALLPTLSEHIARHEEDLYCTVLSRTVQVVLAVTLPLAVLLALVIRPLVGVFGFDRAGTDTVVWTARAYLAGLTGHSLVEVAVRAFYAQKDARTPLLAAVDLTVTFILLAPLLAAWLGAPGIGLANAVAYTGQAGLLLHLLNRRLGRRLLAGGSAHRVASGTLLGGLAAYLILSGLILPAASGLGLVNGILLATAALLAGAAAALPFIWPEVKLLVKL